MCDTESDKMNSNLSVYEQKRIMNLKRKYEFLKSSGLPTPKTPYFEVPKRRNIVHSRRKGKDEENENLFKNVTLNFFGVDKNSKVTKENIPLDSELHKYVNLVQDSRAKKTARKGSRIKLKRKLDVTHLKVLLNTAEHFQDVFGNLLILENSIEVERTILDEQEIEDLSKPRYPKRNVQKKCYKEEDVSSDDDFLHCDKCDFQYKGACPHHGPMIWVRDRKTTKNDPDKAKKTMPHFLSISDSAIPKAGLGVWTEEPLPQGIVFGPYKGKIVRKKQEAQKSGYAWQVWKGQKALHFVEGVDLSASNWLRFVNCANREDQQNLMAIQYKKQVFYKTYKPILPYTEILVWYGGEYASDMGIDTTEDKILIPQHDIDGFECEVCDRLFSSLLALEKHKKQHPRSDRRHRCAQCPYSTDNEYNLRRHLLTHSGERPHRCETCGKGFTRKSNLETHLFLHTGENPFLCSTCGKGFNNKSNFRRHEKTHTGERHHRCLTCGRDFNEAGTLTKHERTHTQQKPFRCPHCQYRSSRSSVLQRHIVSKHTRDFKHNCSFCGKGFTRPSYLKSHILNQHSTDT